MTLTKLKAKNQVTIPSAIVKRLHLKRNELFAVDVQDNYIKLVPVDIEPKYSAAEVDAIERIIVREKGRAKAVKPGKDFSRYLDEMAEE